MSFEGQRGYREEGVAEVDIVEELCLSLGIKPTKPSLQKQDILANQQHHILFKDWQTGPLTVGDLRDYSLYENPPFLAYLSACSTGMIQVYELSDKGIHLVSAFRLAGLQHVVGRLWEVSDEHCATVARVLYKTIRDEGIADATAPRGLHRALRAFRCVELETAHGQRDVVLLDEEDGEQEVTNYHWVPYIHFGI
ncbi:hypothetical protein RU639_002456 [Aspergillus parasiticus]